MAHARRSEARGAALDRLPPQNLQAEQGVLGSVLLDNDALDDVLSILGDDDFYLDAHSVAFRHVRSLRDAGSPVDGITLADAMMASGEFDKFGGDEYLAELMESVPSAANASYYAHIVRQKAIARRLLTAATAIVSDCYSPPPDATAETLVERAEAAVFAVAEGRSGAEPLDVGPVATGVMERIARRAAGEIDGLDLGYTEIDRIFCGIKRQQLVVIAARPAMGKAQPLSAKVLTPDGWVRMGNIRVGSLVVGRDGGWHRVTGVYPQGRRPVYRVAFSDGAATECCEEHLWFTQTRRERRRGVAGSVKTLGEIMRTRDIPNGNGTRTPNHTVPLVEPVRFKPRGELPLHPYLLGLLLGDGSFGRIVAFHKPERDVQERLASLLPPGDAATPIQGGLRIRRRIRGRIRGCVPSATLAALRELGLDRADSLSKFIPDRYLFASVEDRLMLLRGLCDTGGHVTESGQLTEFASSSRRLAEGVRFLARSLGAMVSWAEKEPTYTYKGETRTGETSYRLYISFRNGLCPVSSAKHLAHWKGGTPRYHRTVAAIEPAGEAECQCIAVDAADHLYVTDDFVVTHNTAFSLNLAENLAFRWKHPVLFFSLEMSENELTERLLVSLARVSNFRVRSGRVTPDDMARLGRAYDQLRASPNLLRIDPDIGHTTTSMRAVARRHKRKHGLDAVFVDYLQLVVGEAKSDSEQERITKISRGLKAMAKELDVPVFALSQLNRQNESRADRRPLLSDLRSSGAIEQDADIVMLLHRPDYYDPEDQPGIAEVIVAKNRNGETGTVALQFRKDLMRFEESRDEPLPPALRQAEF